jgi:CrcB protein
VSAAVAVGVALLGGAAAVLRVASVQTIGRFGLLAVNVAGAFALGVLAGAGLDGDAYRLAATGFLGAFTTFSTWMLDLEERRRAAALLVPLALGLAAVWAGRELGAAV